MKTCPKCYINKVKNSYEMCYTCHNNKEETSSEFDKDKETQKLRPILTEILRKALFRRMAQQTIYGFI